MGDEVQEEVAVDRFDRFCNEEVYKFTWVPQTCYITGKKIWLKRGLRRSATWGPKGTTEHRWYDKDEYLVWKLSH